MVGHSGLTGRPIFALNANLIFNEHLKKRSRDTILIIILFFRAVFFYFCKLLNIKILGSKKSYFKKDY